MSCERTRALAAELALGIADGAERGEALRHLATCADCRRAVDQLSAVTDELLLLTPEREPPAGFESRVLARLRPDQPRRRWRRALVPVTAAAGAAAAAVAIALSSTADDRRLADQYRAALGAGHGRSFEATALRGPGEPRAGIVYGYRGTTSWLFVVVYRNHRDVPYAVEVVTKGGRRVALPGFRLDPRSGSAGQALPFDLDRVAAVWLVHGDDVLTAQLP